MNLATRAALYNALLFPGWGHFYLKKYKRGIVFLLPVLAGILAICWAITQVAYNILKANPFPKGMVDLATVIKLSTDSTKALDLNKLSLIIVLIILLWIISIIDAYRLGKKQMDILTTSANQSAVSPPV
ncbi:MAG: hypothetical protein CVU52_01650 [Deltaproteobacteria bacterium HGW-Deltaproteobacteria-10]|nr:MAG: hypothetical protein CVU52_01650 [Deltaproteobacteria bacterium HGW-Deltaproteobacteria-10]